MVCIRPAKESDLLAMQRCNLMCLPENYQLKVRNATDVKLPVSLYDRIASCMLIEVVSAASQLSQ